MAVKLKWDQISKVFINCKVISICYYSSTKNLWFCLLTQENDTHLQIFAGFQWRQDYNKFEWYSEALARPPTRADTLGRCNFFQVRITHSVNQQVYLTWCNRLQQACALELVSIFPERWAAGRFYILKCHCCQRGDGFPSVENKLRGEKKKSKENCYVGDSICHSIVL